MTYTTTESKQLWQHTTSGQVLFLEAIAPQDETDESAEYRYSSQGFDMGSDSDFIAQGWVKLDLSEYVGMPEANPKGWDFIETGSESEWQKDTSLKSESTESFAKDLENLTIDPFAELRASLVQDPENLTAEQKKRLEEAKAIRAQFPIRERASKAKASKII